MIHLYMRPGKRNRVCVRIDLDPACRVFLCLPYPNRPSLSGVISLLRSLDREVRYQVYYPAYNRHAYVVEPAEDLAALLEEERSRLAR